MYPARSTFGECSRSLLDSSFDESFASLRNSSGGGFNRFSSIDSTGFSSITSIASSQFEEQNSLYGRGFYESQDSRAMSAYDCARWEPLNHQTSLDLSTSEEDLQKVSGGKRKNVQSQYVHTPEYKAWVSRKKLNWSDERTVASQQQWASGKMTYNDIWSSLLSAIETNQLTLARVFMNLLSSNVGPFLWENLLRNNGCRVDSSRKTLKEITQFFIQKTQNDNFKRYFNSMYERMDVFYAYPNKQKFKQLVCRTGLLEIQHHVIDRMLITFIKRNTTLISQTPLAPHVQRFFQGRDLNTQGEVRQLLNYDYHEENLDEIPLKKT